MNGRGISAVVIVVVLLILGMLPGMAGAQGGYPAYTDLYVNDFAGLLTDSDAANVRGLFIDLRTTHGIEAVAVTIGSIHDYGTGDETIESFATHLFNTWGIGNAERNDGVLMLVAVNDRDMRIEVGAGYGEEYNREMQVIIDEHMLPRFRKDDYSGGIYQGAQALVYTLTGEWPGGDNPTSPESVPSTTMRTSTQDDDGSVLPPVLVGGGTAGILGAAGVGVQRYRRYRRRRCPHCNTYMQRLDEVSDDVYLESGQKMEEVLKSINYDVWRCPSCNVHELHSYRNWLSGFQRCPSCGYYTVRQTSQVETRATYTSTGLKRVELDCRHCNYHHEHTVVLPKLTRSSSSSGSGSSGGSSFGGGHSSGGGASGSW
ncbi:MAG: TPM domain-containing protein [Anaerolineae bacterium]|nr:TPM domain-containing protein [Anaerolineae bacterium]